MWQKLSEQREECRPAISPRPRVSHSRFVVVLQHLQEARRVGGWEAKRRAASFIHSSDKYFFEFLLGRGRCAGFWVYIIDMAPPLKRRPIYTIERENK